jgi:solute carrier family 10 (sodium/bile acid cotransporter), member 7
MASLALPSQPQNMPSDARNPYNEDWHLAPEQRAVPVPLPAIPAPTTAAAPPPAPSPASPTKDWLIRNHLPLGLFVMVVLGFLWPDPGIAVGKTPISTLSIVGIFFISGLTLETKQIMALKKAHVPIIFGMISIMLVTPLLSFAISPLPLDPPEFAQGLALFCSMPTTISSGQVLTAEAKGNVALALLFSVSTNLLAVATVPLYARQIFAESADSVSIDAWDLFVKLVLIIFLPLCVGKAFRYFDWVCNQVKHWKLQLKLLSSALLISVPWVMMSQASAKLRQISVGSFFLLVVLGVGLHVVLLIINYLGTALVPRKYMPLAERKAVVINASQKTVNTAVSVLLALPAGMSGDAGLMVLPCIISHFAQTIMASFEASWWKRQKDPDAPASGTTAAASGGGGIELTTPQAVVALAVPIVSPSSSFAGDGSKEGEGDKATLKPNIATPFSPTMVMSGQHADGYGQASSSNNVLSGKESAMPSYGYETLVPPAAGVNHLHSSSGVALPVSPPSSQLAVNYYHGDPVAPVVLNGGATASGSGFEPEWR